MEEQQGLSTARNLKIGLFHLGSGMADIIIGGVWNRIMISDLGFSATPISLLGSLRYYLAPLGVWAGRMSDRHAVGGYRRLFWVWLGRAMMVLSIAMLGLTTASIASGDVVNALDWIVMTVAMLLFSLGNAFSGGTFLALIYDRARPDQRGRAVGIVWTFLLVGFTIGGILFGIMLPEHEDGTSTLSFSPDTVQTLFLVAAGLLTLLWFFSLLGEERKSSGAAETENPESSTSLRADLKLAWSNRQTRFFFWYLALSMLFAFSQDFILEPFAGDVFGMEARVTSRFSAYWGSMSILGTIVFLVLNRRIKWMTNTVMSYLGVGFLIAAFALLTLSSFAHVRGLVTPCLIVLGIGLGIWNVGTLGLMMDMSPFGRAGTFLGFWSLVVTISRGLGTSGGGVARDLMLQITNNFSSAYGIVFGLGGIGLLVAFWTLTRVKVKAFKSAETTLDSETVFAGGLD